jgi:DNA-directed RNA polymerase subunit RPC12/RpoP
MIRILAYKYVTTCFRCGCKFEFDDYDLHPVKDNYPKDPKGYIEHRRMIKCPNCGQRILEDEAKINPNSRMTTESLESHN